MIKTIENQYNPDYVSPPGETLKELLEDRNMTQAELARRAGRPEKTISRIINGKVRITPETAIDLERVLRVPAQFWNSREQQYQQFLARHQERQALRGHVEWIKNFPVNEMIQMKWIRKYDDEVRQLTELLTYLGISSPENWPSLSQKMPAVFRQSQAFEKNPFAIIAWLRRGELLAEQLSPQPYDERKFKATLKQIRSLTIKGPSVFESEVIDLCSEAGVAVVIVPEVPGISTSGATRWLSSTLALVQLSRRYKRDDQLWFSFFHEVGHILLHSKRGIFLQGQEIDEKSENEADLFAANTLIPSQEWSRLIRIVEAEKPFIKGATIRAFADEIGIAPGIVVGRLQREKYLPYTHLNKLKIPL